MTIAIDSAKVKGEPGTGYEASDGKGPFACSNCNHFMQVDSTCSQSTMRQVSKQPKTADGMVQVDPEGCCEYVERKGSAKRDAFKAAADARQNSKAPEDQNAGTGAPAAGAGRPAPVPFGR